MKRHKQLVRHDPDNGQNGDCMRTVIACLLGLDSPEGVPNFADEGDDRMMGAADAWLAERGYRRVALGLTGTQEQLLHAMQVWNPGVPFLFVGESPRGTCHVVIAQDGEIIHDPHPDGGGLTGPAPNDGTYWIEILARVPGTAEHHANPEGLVQVGTTRRITHDGRQLWAGMDTTPGAVPEGRYRVFVMPEEAP